MVPSRVCAAIRPRQQMTRGRTSAICRSRYGRQAPISSGCGSRFCGRPALHAVGDEALRRGPARWASATCPGTARRRPTNGRPVLSSSAPGPSPTNITGGSSGALTRARSTVRLAESPHFTQEAISAGDERQAPPRAPRGRARPHRADNGRSAACRDGRAGGGRWSGRRATAALRSRCHRSPGSGCCREKPVVSQSSRRFSALPEALQRPVHSAS